MAESLTDQQVAEAAAHWLSGAVIAPLGAGHIHDTFLLQGQQHAGLLREQQPPGQQVQAPLSVETEIVLQRINEFVFNDPGQLMAQTSRLLACWSQQRDYQCPQLIPSLDGTSFVHLSSGYWRAWRRLAGVTVDPAQTPQQAYAAGLAFARLQCQLAHLPAPPLAPTIDHFLQLEYYLAQFDGVAHQADKELLAQIDAHRPLATEFKQAGSYFSHIHGDCKIDNLLFDPAAREVVAILDFDTAMSAPRALDFGDLIRSIALSRGRVEVAMFEAALRGFSDGGVGLTVDEALIAPRYVTFMLAVRFLTDHLQGDSYFKVASHGENLARAESQFDLLTGLSEQGEALASVARTICAEKG